VDQTADQNEDLDACRDQHAHAQIPRRQRANHPKRDENRQAEHLADGEHVYQKEPGGTGQALIERAWRHQLSGNRESQASAVTPTRTDDGGAGTTDRVGRGEPSRNRPMKYIIASSDHAAHGRVVLRREASIVDGDRDTADDERQGVAAEHHAELPPAVR
jgi:hypothetical protein